LATITGFRVLPVVAMVSPDYIACRIRVRPQTCSRCHWRSCSIRPISPHTFDLLGRPRAVLEYRYPTQRIWGATAHPAQPRERLQALP
jgi:hypothetical protein